MKTLIQKLPLCIVTGAMALSGCAVIAEPPPGPGPRQERRDDDRRGRGDDRHDDKHDKKRGDRDDDRRGGRDDDRRGGGSVQVTVGGYFGERQRDSVYEYYGQSAKSGKCPPGLAKKGNGCLPPGQAKKWKLGQPLPRDISYRPVEADVRVRIGIPPAGYEFVRVAQDILMIAVGTAIVIDAIEDLQR